MMMMMVSVPLMIAFGCKAESTLEKNLAECKEDMKLLNKQFEEQNIGIVVEVKLQADIRVVGNEVRKCGYHPALQFTWVDRGNNDEKKATIKEAYTPTYFKDTCKQESQEQIQPPNYEETVVR